MSLRILFADDSMTAQNMGKKILSEAGYDVVAVSNGAAAVKKIAEQKPDIIILDVYMPGYSGLEVCEKVRGSLDTLKIPVLLTVGKMEPYKPEDANRVKADGVIIKPFEASDLLAIIKKFEERIGNAPPPPIVAQPVRQEIQYEDSAANHAEAVVETRSSGKSVGQPMVEVPDHMANSAAFGDFLGSEPVHDAAHFAAVNTPAAAFETSVIVPAPPVPAAENDIPVSWTREEAPEPPAAAPVEALPEAVVEPAEAAPEIVATPVEAEAAPEPILEAVPEPEVVAAEYAPEAVAANPEPVLEPEAAPAPTHPQFIPVFKEPEAAGGGYDLMPTSAPPITELEIPREPALQETADVVTRSTVVDRVEPGLMSTIGQQVEAFPLRSAETPSAAPADVTDVAPTASVPEVSAPAPVVEQAAQLTDADFEARVAAAMAAYGHGAEPETASAPVAEPEAQASAQEQRPGAATDIYAVPAVVAEPQPVSAPVPSFEYQPAARSVAPTPAARMEHEEIHAMPAPQVAPAAPHAVADHESAVGASVEAAMPEVIAAAAGESAEDQHTIAQAVHRAMERLKPDLVQAIMKELKSKK